MFFAINRRDYRHWGCPPSCSRTPYLYGDYFKNKGVQLQINLVDKETLLDTQAHPEKHSDLIVRVGGYCEYFNNLDRKLQDEVIAHMVQDLG